MQYPGQRHAESFAIIRFMKEENDKQETAIDPVCDMEVDTAEARAERLVSEYRGKTYYFCCAMCKESFEEGPSEYLE